MGEHDGKAIAVVGATGLQGRAVTARLLEHGWRVRALTRDPDGKQARALAALGTDVMRTDSADQAGLERSFTGVQGVYSVQNHHISGYHGEITQARTWQKRSSVPVSATSCMPPLARELRERGSGRGTPR